MTFEPGIAHAALSPFGLRVEPRVEGAALAVLPVALLLSWVQAHRVLVLRGFAPLLGDDLPAFSAGLGDLYARDAGTVHEDDSCMGADVGAWADQEIPMHWDRVGARGVRYLVFHCDAAPPRGGGGETLFSDTTRVLAATPEAVRAALMTVEVRCADASRIPLVGRHPLTGDAVLRYAEPVDEQAIAQRAQTLSLLANLRRRLYDPAVCYAHPWREGDVLLADNHTLLHGRAAFARDSRRRLRRVYVMEPR